MSQTCTCNSNNRMILTCSGASNVGQLANRAAVELTQEGFGKMFCLAGVGGGLQGFVQSARDVPRLIVIEGCQVGCAKAILDREGIEPGRYKLVTDLGIDKNHDLNLNAEEVEKIKEAVRADG